MLAMLKIASILFVVWLTLGLGYVLAQYRRDEWMNREEATVILAVYPVFLCTDVQDFIFGICSYIDRFPSAILHVKEVNGFVESWLSIGCLLAGYLVYTHKDLQVRLTTIIVVVIVWPLILYLKAAYHAKHHPRRRRRRYQFPHILKHP